MHDRPTGAELLAAARLFLESELIPTLSDARLRFQTLVTANVLAIVEREMQAEEKQLTEEWETLGKLLHRPAARLDGLAALRTAVGEANDELCRRIRDGSFDERARFHALSGELRRVVEQKLAVANPKYLANFTSEGVERR
jgi:hypothetical protein